MLNLLIILRKKQVMTNLDKRGGFEAFLPLILISWEAFSGSRSDRSSELWGAGGKRIRNPNRCFFFLISFPDMNLEPNRSKTRFILSIQICST